MLVVRDGEIKVSGSFDKIKGHKEYLYYSETRKALEKKEEESGKAETEASFGPGKLKAVLKQSLQVKDLSSDLDEGKTMAARIPREIKANFGGVKGNPGFVLAKQP